MFLSMFTVIGFSMKLLSDRPISLRYRRKTISGSDNIINDSTYRLYPLIIMELIVANTLIIYC